MSNKILLTCLRPHVQIAMRNAATLAEIYPKVGNRDIVGHGYNGDANYLDRADFPMPAIRFMPNTPEIMALREKEKGDWKKLSIEEKKALYRASYRQTFSEFMAPTGEWKGQVGVTLMVVSFTLAMMIIIKVYALPPLPYSFSEERRLAQRERMEILEMNPITGIGARK